MKEFNSSVLSSMLESSRTVPEWLTVIERTGVHANVYTVVFHENDTPDTLYCITGFWSGLDRTFSFSNAQEHFTRRETPGSYEVECHEVEAFETTVVQYRRNND